MTSCKDKHKNTVSYENHNLQSYLEIKNIDVKEESDTYHFVIEIETEAECSAFVFGAGDSAIKQFFTLIDGKGTCNFVVQDNEWSIDTPLFFNVFKDDVDSFTLTINKDNLKALKSFSYTSKKEKPKSINVKFCDQKLNSFICVKDLTVIDNNDSYKFHLEVNGKSNMCINVFDNPNGDVIKKEFGTIKSNNGLIDFDVSNDILSDISELELLIGDDIDNLTISFNPNKLDEIEYVTYGNSELNIINYVNVDTSTYKSNFVFNSQTYEK